MCSFTAPCCFCALPHWKCANTAAELNADQLHTLPCSTVICASTPAEGLSRSRQQTLISGRSYRGYSGVPRGWTWEIATSVMAAPRKAAEFITSWHHSAPAIPDHWQTFVSSARGRQPYFQTRASPLTESIVRQIQPTGWSGCCLPLITSKIPLFLCLVHVDEQI